MGNSRGLIIPIHRVWLWQAAGFLARRGCSHASSLGFSFLPGGTAGSRDLTCLGGLWGFIRGYLVLTWALGAGSQLCWWLDNADPGEVSHRDPRQMWVTQPTDDWSGQGKGAPGIRFLLKGVLQAIFPMEGALQSNTFHKVYPFSHFAFPTWYPADEKPRTEGKKMMNGGVGLSGITCPYSKNRTESREEQCSTLFELIELCSIIIIQLLLLNHAPFLSTISGVLVSGCPKLLKDGNVASLNIMMDTHKTLKGLL